MDFVNKIFRGDRVIWMIFLFLCVISIVEVYSASSTLTFKIDQYWKPILRHSMFLLVGTGVILVTHSLKPKHFAWLTFVLPIAWLLMIATKLFGPSVNETNRWLAVGGVTFQPSELAKLCLIVAVALILSKLKNEESDKSFKWICSLSAITCLLIVMDNFSTAAMLFGIVILMMFVGQIPMKKILKLCLILIVFIVAIFSIIYYTPAEYLKGTPLARGKTWIARLIEFKEEIDVHHKEFKIDDDNFQESHAKMAIANGGILGKMPGRSQQRDYLPQAYSDFIFVIIIEEMGLLGGLFVLFLYLTLLFRSGIIALRSEKPFSKYLVLGSALIIVTQAFANMAVAVDLIPVTGQPLPLISRGGTSTLITCIYVGIILSVSRFDNPKGIKREEEIEEELKEQEEAAKEKLVTEWIPELQGIDLIESEDE